MYGNKTPPLPATLPLPPESGCAVPFWEHRIPFQLFAYSLEWIFEYRNFSFLEKNVFLFQPTCPPCKSVLTKHAMNFEVNFMLGVFIQLRLCHIKCKSTAQTSVTMRIPFITGTHFYLWPFFSFHSFMATDPSRSFLTTKAAKYQVVSWGIISTYQLSMPSSALPIFFSPILSSRLFSPLPLPPCHICSFSAPNNKHPFLAFFRLSHGIGKEIEIRREGKWPW